MHQTTRPRPRGLPGNPSAGVRSSAHLCLAILPQPAASRCVISAQERTQRPAGRAVCVYMRVVWSADSRGIVIKLQMSPLLRLCACPSNPLRSSRANPAIALCHSDAAMR
ncbi:hypothetical protein FKP32DRAFT_97564 [Trametes sanguinea]|nr:hypothetical protein FKP32DRAFT_97564 [Trametes sanguinea]